MSVSLLAPGAAILAAAIALPAVILLHVLRLRRRTLRISSTLLWQSRIRDVEGNAPFQRLRPSVLLILQFLAAICLALAAGDPVRRGGDAMWMRTVLLIDQSASMQVRDQVSGRGDAVSRLERALIEGERLVERLLRHGEEEIMVVAFGAGARVIVPFEQRAAVVRAGMRSIVQTDEAADHAAALAFVRDLLRGGGARGDAAGVIVLTDAAPPVDSGAGRGAREHGGASWRWIRIGPGSAGVPENVGMTAIGGRRDPERPDLVRVLATVERSGSGRVASVLEALVDGEVRGTRALRFAEDVHELSARFEFAIPGAGLVTIRHRLPDALAADDEASLVFAAPMPPRITLVHPPGGPDPHLRLLLESAEPERLLLVERPGERARENGVDPDVLMRPGDTDLIVLDRVPLARWPVVPAIVIGAAAPDVERIDPVRPGARRVAAWDRSHPLLRLVSLDRLAIAGGPVLRAPSGASVLVTDEVGPAIIALRRAGVEHVVIAFEIGRTNWPADLSFAIFFRNLLDLVGAGSGGAAGAWARPGEAVEVRTDGAGDGAIAVRDMGGAVLLTARSAPGGRVTLQAPGRAGVYRLDGAAGPAWLAVNVASSSETGLAPTVEAMMAPILADQPSTTSIAVGATPLRGWFFAAALILLAVEWLWWSRIVASA